MRTYEQSSMIGSLLFYGLYPLSRYLTGRPAGAPSPESVPPAVVNGTAVWDGGVVTTRRVTPSQTTVLDQRLSPGSGPTREAKERMNAQSPKGDSSRSDKDKEQLMAVLREEERESEVKPEGQEREDMQDGQQQDREEAPQQEVREMYHNMFDMKQNTEDGTAFTSEDVSPEIKLGAQLESLHTGERVEEASCQVQDRVVAPSGEESVAPAEESVQYTTYPVEKQTQMQISEGSLSSAEPSGQEMECWDEYVAPAPAAAEQHGGVNDATLVFESLLSNTQTHLKFNKHDTAPGWHFPTGPGLLDEVHCPPWQFPTMSYYPSVEPLAHFEVMWRVWEEMDESATAAEPPAMQAPFSKAWMDFTVMSYNILAQDLLEANEELYTHCPMEVLDWSFRCSRLFEEIHNWAPDILCLQEVQENHYHEQLHPFLSQMGYTCVYKRRTGDKTDGCATCYRSSRFSEVSVTKLEFLRPQTELLDRHNVGIVLLLRPVVTQGTKVKAKGSLLCVANTHLLFNPRRGDIKLAQLAIVLAEIQSVVKSCKAQGEHCNVILCGDFNSVPHMPLYQLVTSGEVYYQGLPAWMISGQEDLSHKAVYHRLFAPLWPSCLGITDSCQYASVNEVQESPASGKYRYSHDFLLQLRFCPQACVRPLDLQLIPGVTDNTPETSTREQQYERRFRDAISHRLDLESVYKHILPGSGSPEVTTLHTKVGATVDYIFYSPKRSSTSHEKADVIFESEGLKLIGCLSLLSEDVLWSMEGLPNHIFPSDHLSLLAKFRLDLNAA